MINETSTRLEKSFGHYILNQFLEKTKKSMNNIFKRFTIEDSFCSCSDEISIKPVDYKIEPEKIFTLRTMLSKIKKTDVSLSECKINFFLNFFS